MRRAMGPQLRWWRSSFGWERQQPPLRFLFTVQRVLRAQKVELPNNTFVWMRYFGLLLLAEVVNCFLLLVFSLVKSTVAVGVVISCSSAMESRSPPGVYCGCG